MTPREKSDQSPLKKEICPDDIRLGAGEILTEEFYWRLIGHNTIQNYSHSLPEASTEKKEKTKKISMIHLAHPLNGSILTIPYIVASGVLTP
jgi:hypothetical protein